jgi:hypothetical protein
MFGLEGRLLLAGRGRARASNGFELYLNGGAERCSVFEVLPASPGLSRLITIQSLGKTLGKANKHS